MGIVGLGYVGLPLAMQFARIGFSTYGIDVSEEKVKKINNGESYIDDLSSSVLRDAMASGKFVASSDWDCVAELDAIILCVPTPFTEYKEPDLSYVVNATEEIASRMRPPQLITLESTIYPGATQEVVLPILEKRGYRVGRDFFLAYSPERIDPGNINYKVGDIPKIVGGVTIDCKNVACALYENVVAKVVGVTSPKAAEMAKLLENIFRNVNIALVNELTMLCDRMKIDIWEVVAAAATKPFGFMSFRPGPGVGGHCIPVDPVYLSWKAKEYDFYTDFINLASKVNSNMPYFVARKLLRTLLKNDFNIHKDKALVLGVTFKKDIADARNSSAFKLMERMLVEGVDIDFHDPFIDTIEVSGKKLKSIALTKERIASYGCVLIHTDHSSYNWDFITNSARLVFDTRNATKYIRQGRDKIFKL
ncbi:nucleotide sugar dehydrogenase [Elusimicrobiota bacterium]